MVQGTDCCGIFVTKKVLLIATITIGATMLASFIILCVGLGMDCYYESDCNAEAALIITGGILTGFSTIFLVVIIVLLFKMGDASPTTSFMPPQPYANYGSPIVSTSTVQAASHPAPYVLPSMGYPQYQQHPQTAVPQVPLAQEHMPQAPMPHAPMPQAPMPQAPMPQAPMPHAPMPQAPMPQAPMPLKPSC